MNHTVGTKFLTLALMSSTVVPPSDEASCFFSPPPNRFPIPSVVFWRLTLSLMMLVGEDCLVNRSAGGAVKALVSKYDSEAVNSTTNENSDGPVMIIVSVYRTE